MCGIGGLFSTRMPLEEIRARLRAGAECIRHRGPDDEGFWTDPQLNGGFAHRRLSILDLSPAGHQPMADKSGRWVITLNGELYNFKNLRSILEKSFQTKFLGTSDTEVAVEYISAFGIQKALADFKGMFAFGVIDLKEKKLFLARDRAGEKPIFYSHNEHEISFSSELPSLLKMSSQSPSISRDSLAEFLRFNFIPAPNSIYEQVKKIPPACLLEVILESRLVIKPPEAYWNAEVEFHKRSQQRPIPSYHEQLKEFDHIFTEAVKGQLQADVPVGAFLSGGIDSSAVVATMAKLSSQPVRTYTIGFLEAEYDESNYARKVAEFFSTQHEEQILSAADALAMVPDISRTFGEPFGDPSAIPTMLVSKMAARSVKVALSGDGGDELFGGYPHYTTVGRIWPKISKFPYWSRSMLVELLPLVPKIGWQAAEILLKQMAGDQSLRRPLHETWRGLNTLLKSRDFRDFYVRLIYSPQASERLLREKVESQNLSSKELNAPIQKQMMLLDLQRYLPDDILTKTDRSAMKYSLELRSPFLDKDLMEFSFSLPLSSNILGTNGKVILRDYLKQKLPPELFERPKKGFSVPVGQWIRGPLKEWARDLLSETDINRDGWLNATAVKEDLADHFDGRTDREQLLWNCLMFQNWLRDR